MTSKLDSQRRGKKEFIVTVWKRRGGKPVGQKELRAIQQAIGKTFGTVAAESPARIARILADEGAELQHPEIIEGDAIWRAREIAKLTSKFTGIQDLLDPALPGLNQARVFIERCEQARQDFESDADQTNLQRLRDIAIHARQTAQRLSNDVNRSRSECNQQQEIVQWLTVWLQTPALFGEWLDLRMRSAEYLERFSDLP